MLYFQSKWKENQKPLFSEEATVTKQNSLLFPYGRGKTVDRNFLITVMSLDTHNGKEGMLQLIYL